MGVYQDNKSYASAGVGTTALVLSSVATAFATGLLNNGFGGMFGGNQNPTASASYQLSQKDTIIAKLESERYADKLAMEKEFEIANLKQRLAAIEAAAPLREKIVGEQIGFVGATVNRLVQPMIPSINVSYPTSTASTAQAA